MKCIYLVLSSLLFTQSIFAEDFHCDHDNMWSGTPGIWFSYSSTAVREDPEYPLEWLRSDAVQCLEEAIANARSVCRARTNGEGTLYTTDLLTHAGEVKYRCEKYGKCKATKLLFCNSASSEAPDFTPYTCSVDCSYRVANERISTPVTYHGRPKKYSQVQVVRECRKICDIDETRTSCRASSSNIRCTRF